MVPTFIIISILFLLMSLLPSFRITHWSVQIFDYIRIQVLFIQLFVLVGSFFLFNNLSAPIILSQSVLFIAASYQLYIILPYLSISSIFEEKDAEDYDNSDKEISIISANVLQKNMEYHKLIELVRRVDPDILLTTETNKQWEMRLKKLAVTFLTTPKLHWKIGMGCIFTPS